MTTVVPLQLLSQSAKAALTAYRNLLMNPMFRINQRSYAGAPTTVANQYTRDRWFVPASGQSVNFSASGNWFIAIVPESGLAQVVEAQEIMPGTHVLSWAGTATATVNGAPVTSGVPFPLLDGGSVTVVFRSGTLLFPQLEYGSVATDFERAPYAVDYLRCRRYYRREVVSLMSPAAGSILAPFNFEQPMRATPSVTVAGPGTVDSAVWEPTIMLNSQSGYHKLTASVAGGWGTFRVLDFSAEL